MCQDNDKKRQDPEKPPDGLAAMHSLASGYGQYLSYLKSGGKSGITGEFGKILLKEGDRFSENSLRQDCSREATGTHSPDTDGSSRIVSVEDKLGAVFAIFSGDASVQDVARSYSVCEALVDRWLEKACLAMEAALSTDDS
jgi:hypothetical protein